jgi:DNA-binding transcriptional LysR family regulator
MDWDKLRIFQAVADVGSLTRAGAQLGLSQSAVSRQILSLERALNAALFHRHRRGLVLTEQGEILLNASRDMAARLARAETSLIAARAKPSGTLHVIAPATWAIGWLSARLSEFIALYPGIGIELSLAEAEIDASADVAEIAIRMRQPTRPDLVQRRLFTERSHLYAAASYVRQHSAPRRAEELERHRLIVCSAAATGTSDAEWLLAAGVAPERVREPAFKINSRLAAKVAIESGFGLGLLPDYLVYGEARLHRVLPDLRGPSADAFFVYPAELRHAKRISAFRDFLLQKIADWQF